MSNELPPINRFTFGGFYRIERDNGGLDPESIIEDFSDSSLNESGLVSRFETINLEKAAEENVEASEYLESFASRFSACRYLYEIQNRRAYISDDSGEVKEKTVREAHAADIFWAASNYIYIRGDRDACEEVESIIRQKSGDTLISEIVINSEFLVWLFYKCREKQPLRREFSLQRITDIELIHQGQLRGVAGGDYSGTEVENAIRPMADILQGANITRLSGEFEVAGYSVDADVHKGDHVHIPSGKGSLTDSSDLRRLLITLRFIHEIVDLYIEWEHEDKHPPAHFYYDLYNDIEDNGFSINFSSDDVLEINDHILSNRGNLVTETEAEIIDAGMDEILNQGESETIEFKADIPGHKENIAKELVALANYKGGVLVIGVNDDDEPIGLENYKEKEETVTNIIDSSIQPPLDVSIQFEYSEEKPLLVLRVGQRRKLPHAADYTFYTRLGTTKRQLSPYELNYLMTEESEID